jgi:hypothetical protein
MHLRGNEKEIFEDFKKIRKEKKGIHHMRK